MTNKEEKCAPAPWIAEPQGGRGAWIKGANGKWVALACGDTHEEADAHARIIVAAPLLEKALKDVLASLAAAHSLLSRGGKKAAASDKMFEIMLSDYEKSIERGRAALGVKIEPEEGEL